MESHSSEGFSCDQMVVKSLSSVPVVEIKRSLLVKLLGLTSKVLKLIQVITTN